MEDKENEHMNNVSNVNAEEELSIEVKLEQPPKRRPIRRCRLKKEKTVNHGKKNKNIKHISASPPIIKEFINKKVTEVHQQINSDEITQKTLLLGNMLVPNIGKKIYYNPWELEERYWCQIRKKEKLKNTDLMISGTKYVSELTEEVANKWEKALIIYQKEYGKNSRCHFGLVLKYMEKIISFDGILKLWPIKNAMKSYHWSEQTDTWSCGYRVLFWVKRILEIGILEWVSEYEILGRCDENVGDKIEMREYTI